MVKPANNAASRAAYPVPGYTEVTGGPEAAQLAEIAAATARLRRDLDACHPNNPSLAFALAAETHLAMRNKWDHYPQNVQAALWLAFLNEVTELHRQLQIRIARSVPTAGYMYGLEEDSMNLESQADIMQEEIHRIEADLQVLLAVPGEALQ